MNSIIQNPRTLDVGLSSEYHSRFVQLFPGRIDEKTLKTFCAQSNDMNEKWIKLTESHRSQPSQNEINLFVTLFGIIPFQILSSVWSQFYCKFTRKTQHKYIWWLSRKTSCFGSHWFNPSLVQWTQKKCFLQFHCDSIILHGLFINDINSMMANT